MQHGERFNILINRDSGTVRKLGPEGVEAVISDSSIKIKSVIFAGGADIEARFLQLMAEDYPVLLGGGDGTIAHAVSYFQPVQKPFGILPMGTMNLLASDLGIPIELNKSLTAYAAGINEIMADMCDVNGRPFLCCAALGVMPEASVFRETRRDSSDAVLLPQLTLFILEQLKRTNNRKLSVTMDGMRKRMRTAALIVSNNEYGHELRGGDVAINKETLSDGIMGIYNIAPRNLWDGLKLLFKLRVGGWKSDPFVHEYTARQVEIHSGNKTELISIDGEPVEMEMPLRFHLRHNALRLLLPVLPVADK